MSLYIYGDVEEKKIKQLSDNIELTWVFNERERTDDYCNRITNTDVFVKIKSLLIQTMVSGDMLKFAFGFVEILIGPTV